MKLTGHQIQQIRDALLDAYPTRDTLRMMVAIELEHELEEIAGGENQRVVIFNLVRWAEQSGGVDALIAGAYNQNPGNPALQGLLEQWRTQAQPVGEPKPVLAEPASIDLFLCYSRKDSNIMHQVLETLRDAGLSVWTDEGLEPGTQSWQDAIAEALDQAQNVVVLLSPNANASSWVKREISFAQSKRKRILPLLIGGDETGSIPISLIDTQWVDGRVDLQQAVVRTLLPALRREPHPPVVDTPDNQPPPVPPERRTRRDGTALWLVIALLVGALGFFAIERFLWPAPSPAATPAVVKITRAPATVAPARVLPKPPATTAPAATVAPSTPAAISNVPAMPMVPSEPFPGAGGPVSLVFASWRPMEETAAMMIEAFTANNAGINVEFVLADYDMHAINLIKQRMSGTLPDIVGMEPGVFIQEFHADLMPLQECAVQNWGKNWQDMFYPIALEQARLGNPSGDENFYVLPMQTQTLNLWYTRPLLEEADLRPPVTLEEYKALAKVFNARGIAPLALGAAEPWQRRDIYLQIINDLAPGKFDAAELGEARFTDPEFVRAMEIWKQLFDEGIVQPNALDIWPYPDTVELIESGRAATFPLGSWWQQRQATLANAPKPSRGAEDFFPFLFPDVSGDDRPPGPVGGVGLALGISKHTRHPEAACRVVADFVAGAAAQMLVDEFNDLPAVRGLTPSTFRNENQRDIWTLFTEEWLPNVHHSRNLRDLNVRSTLEDVLWLVAAGETTPADAMQAVQDAWTPPTP